MRIQTSSFPVQLTDLCERDTVALSACSRGWQRGGAECQIGSSGSVQVPNAEAPSGGWPLVVLCSETARRVNPVQRMLIAEGISRWGVAVVWSDSAFDFSRWAARGPERLALNHAPNLINSTRAGYVVLADDGVEMKASHDGAVCAAGHMDIHVDSAADEIGMWMVEQLWANHTVTH